MEMMKIGTTLGRLWLLRAQVSNQFPHGAYQRAPFVLVSKQKRESQQLRLILFVVPLLIYPRSVGTMGAQIYK